LQARGKLFVGAGEQLYEGMIVGIHVAGENDLTVNAVRPKQLTNIRSAGADEAIVLHTPIRMTLERAIEFIEDDELVEVTPSNIRLRKKILQESLRPKKSGKRTKD
jgi:GTP-binding protein